MNGGEHWFVLQSIKQAYIIFESVRPLDGLLTVAELSAKECFLPWSSHCLHITNQ